MKYNKWCKKLRNKNIIMRSELNVTHSTKWKAEAFGDHPIAFVSWWLLRCCIVTWPRCCNQVTWLDDLPVSGREGVPSPVSVQGGNLPSDMDGFCYPLWNQSVSWWRMETSLREWVRKNIMENFPCILNDQPISPSQFIKKVCALNDKFVHFFHFLRTSYNIVKLL